MTPEELSQASLLDLFRIEAEEQAQKLTAGLLALERDPVAAQHLESCMRAAHSLKGAARIAAITACVSIAHAMENCFVTAQQGQPGLQPATIDKLLQGVDLRLEGGVLQSRGDDAGRQGEFRASQLELAIVSLGA